MFEEFKIDWSTAQTEGMITPDNLLAVPESTWLTGAIANLFAPFPVNTGLWQSDQMVNQFVKIPDGRWQSVPAADIYYPDLMALSLAAPVRSVDNPEAVEVIEYELVSPPEPIPSAPIDLQRIAFEGDSIQFATSVGIWQPVEKKTAVATNEQTQITSKPNGVPWWVWAGGAALGIYVLTRK